VRPAVAGEAAGQGLLQEVRVRLLQEALPGRRRVRALGLSAGHIRSGDVPLRDVQAAARLEAQRAAAHDVPRDRHARRAHVPRPPGPAGSRRRVRRAAGGEEPEGEGVRREDEKTGRRQDKRGEEKVRGRQKPGTTAAQRR